jgi:ring-1,2-phenylacetyl-CoA epoxidase subunit PaaE
VLSVVLPAREVVQATPRTRIIRAALGEQVFPFQAGQAVFAGLADSTVRRPYSIACSPGQARREQALELLVRIDDHAAPDPHLERAVPGTQLRIDGPFGSFNLAAPLVERDLLLIAGGTGIAPLRAIMWDTLERHPDVRIALIYSARSREEFAYWDELSQLAAQQRIRLASTVTREWQADWSGATGRIDDALIRSMLASPDTRCALCGPAGMIATATALLQRAGVREDRILTETYNA